MLARKVWLGGTLDLTKLFKIKHSLAVIGAIAIVAIVGWTRRDSEPGICSRRGISLGSLPLRVDYIETELGHMHCVREYVGIRQPSPHERMFLADIESSIAQVGKTDAQRIRFNGHFRTENKGCFFAFRQLFKAGSYIRTFVTRNNIEFIDRLPRWSRASVKKPNENIIAYNFLAIFRQNLRKAERTANVKKCSLCRYRSLISSTSDAPKLNGEYHENATKNRHPHIRLSMQEDVEQLAKSVAYALGYVIAFVITVILFLGFFCSVAHGLENGSIRFLFLGLFLFLIGGIITLFVL
jgi:hypothetical protein